MSPSPADSWLSDFEELLAPSATSSSSFSDLAISSSSAATGISGGIDGEFGGGAKQSHLFFFSTALLRAGSVCLGVIGSSGRRFCIKKVGTCSAKCHSVKFNPAPDTFYLKGNDTCAHTQPCLPSSMVPPDELVVIQASKHSVEDWTEIFTRYADNRAPAAGAVQPLELFNKVALKTPAKPPSSSAAEKDIMVYSPRGIRQI
jgi:hypothetical protein